MGKWLHQQCGNFGTIWSLPYFKLYKLGPKIPIFSRDKLASSWMWYSLGWVVQICNLPREISAYLTPNYLWQIKKYFNIMIQHSMLCSFPTQILNTIWPPEHCAHPESSTQNVEINRFYFLIFLCHWVRKEKKVS